MPGKHVKVPSHICQEIREKYLTGTVTMDDLAKEYNLGRFHVRGVIIGKKDGIKIEPEQMRQIRLQLVSRGTRKKTGVVSDKTARMYSIPVPEYLKATLIELVAERKSQIAIAKELGIGQGTVSRYLQRLRADGELE